MILMCIELLIYFLLFDNKVFNDVILFVCFKLEKVYFLIFVFNIYVFLSFFLIF